MIAPNAINGRLTIGALLPLSGAYQQFGQLTLDLVNAGLKECREWLAAIAPGVDLQLVTEDIGPSGPGAAAAYQRLLAQGAAVTIGGEDSEQLSTILPLAASRSATHLNYISTSPSLAAADGVFRMLPQDRHEGAWMAELMYGPGEGIRTLVPVWRGDIFGDELVAAMRARFVELGGTVASGVRYPLDTTDFAPTVRTIASQLKQAFGNAQGLPAAVYLVGFEEAATLLHTAVLNPEMPLVKWYGSNGTVLSDAVVQDPVAAAYAAMVHFTNPAIALPDFALPKWRGAMAKAGLDWTVSPNVFTLSAYDALWLAVQALLAAGTTTSGEALRRALAKRADWFCGATGWCGLDAYGDRRALPFVLWDVRLTSDGHVWSL